MMTSHWLIFTNKNNEEHEEIGKINWPSSFVIFTSIALRSLCCVNFASLPPLRLLGATSSIAHGGLIWHPTCQRQEKAAGPNLSSSMLQMTETKSYIPCPPHGMMETSQSAWKEARACGSTMIVGHPSLQPTQWRLCVMSPRPNSLECTFYFVRLRFHQQDWADSKTCWKAKQKQKRSRSVPPKPW